MKVQQQSQLTDTHTDTHTRKRADYLQAGGRDYNRLHECLCHTCWPCRLLYKATNDEKKGKKEGSPGAGGVPVQPVPFI